MAPSGGNGFYCIFGGTLGGLRGLQLLEQVRKNNDEKKKE
jgi:hypothetical protein